MKDKVEYLFNQLSSDWDTLTEDDDLQNFVAMKIYWGVERT
jgi:hypothetical protein